MQKDAKPTTFFGSNFQSLKHDFLKIDSASYFCQKKKQISLILNFSKILPRLANAATQESQVLCSSTSHSSETFNTPWQ